MLHRVRQLVFSVFSPSPALHNRPGVGLNTLTTMSGMSCVRSKEHNADAAAQEPNPTSQLLQQDASGVSSISS